jgi:hypothetical protein
MKVVVVCLPSCLHQETMQRASHQLGGSSMAGTNGGPVPGLFDEQIVYGALDAIEQALEQALTARTEIQQRWQLNQLRGLLLTLPSSGLDLEDSLRQLIRLLRTPVVDR